MKDLVVGLLILGINCYSAIGVRPTIKEAPFNLFNLLSAGLAAFGLWTIIAGVFQLFA